MILTEKPKKNLSQCHFVHHKSHWIDLGANPDRRSERPATKPWAMARPTFNLTTQLTRILVGIRLSLMYFWLSNLNTVQSRLSPSVYKWNNGLSEQHINTPICLLVTFHNDLLLYRVIKKSRNPFLTHVLFVKK
jgi:hypothetical protein